MSEVKTIPWNGSHVAFKRWEDGTKWTKARQRLGHSDICPLCLDGFDSRDSSPVILIVSNQAGVPNRTVHSKCFDDKTPERPRINRRRKRQC